MPSSRRLIASNTLTSSAASVTFSSIPGTYTDLVLKVSVRDDNTSGFDRFQVEFNSDTAANYSSTQLIGNSSTASSERQTGFAYLYNQQAVNTSGQTSNTFSNLEMYFPNYTVSQNKPSSFAGAAENNASAANSAFITAGANLWRNTAAITSIKLTCQGYNFVTGSSFFLYGISNT